MLDDKQVYGDIGFMIMNGYLQEEDIQSATVY